MYRLVAAIAAVTFVASGCASAASAPPARQLVPIGAGLRGPSGLGAAVVGHGLANVAAFAFDEQRRLWASTASYRDTGTDGVYLVPGSGADPVPVVSGLHTPLGLLWYGDSLYVASHTRVDAFSGFDGARFASRRTILTLPANVGESNGLVLAPDGTMLLGISAPCDHCEPPTPWSAAVVSFRPDGSGLRMFANRIRAPVGLTFVPGTSRLLVTMNQRDDLGARTPGDWLGPVQAGQSWGFPACYGQGGSPCAGVPRPTAVLDKHAAVDGIAIVTGQLGPAVGTAAVVAEWATGTVQSVALQPKNLGGPGPVRPFLVGLRNPVPVAVAPDGAIVVGDWGSGLVYRIARTG